MGGIVIIGLLMMASGPRSKGIRESEGALGSGCGCLEDSPRAEVLSLLGGALYTDGSGVETSVVSAWRISAEEG